MAEREGGRVHAFDVDTGAYVGAWWRHAPSSLLGEVEKQRSRTSPSLLPAAERLVLG